MQDISSGDRVIWSTPAGQVRAGIVQRTRPLEVYVPRPPHYVEGDVYFADATKVQKQVPNDMEGGA